MKRTLNLEPASGVKYVMGMANGDMSGNISHENKADEIMYIFDLKCSNLFSDKKFNLKSITLKKIFHRSSRVKPKLWGGNFWTWIYYVNTVGQYSNFETIRNTKPREKYTPNISQPIEAILGDFCGLRYSSF